MRRSLTFWPLLATIYFCVSGGPYGLEPTFQAGKGLGLALVLVTPLIWAYPAAMMSAELGSAIPEEGGYYVWVKRALGPFPAYLCAMWTWLYAWVDVAIYPGLFAVNLDAFLRQLGFGADLVSHPWAKWATGLLVIVPFTALNVWGTRRVGIGAVLALAALAAPFVAMIVMGAPHLVSHASGVFTPFRAEGSSTAVSVGLFSVMWNYLGWDSTSTVAGEVHDPQRSIPRALLVGVAIVTLSYLVPSLVGLAVEPDVSRWKEGAWTLVAAKLGGRSLAIAISLGGTLSAAGLFASSLLASSRLPFVLAADGYLPRKLRQVHPKFGTPVVAILLSALFYTIFSYSRFEDLKVVDVILYSFALAFEFIALIVLRRKAPEMERPYRIKGGTVGVWAVAIVPMALAGFAIVMQLRSESIAAPLSLGVLALTAIAYPFLARGRARYENEVSFDSMT